MCAKAAKAAPTDTTKTDADIKKGMGHVAQLALLLKAITSLVQDQVAEAEREGERAQFLRPDAGSTPAPVSVAAMTIQAIQTALNAHGTNPALIVDGDFGPRTLAALEAFQTAKGLSADGVAGPLTQAALLKPAA